MEEDNFEMDEELTEVAYIQVSQETRRRLQGLVIAFDFENYDEAIQWLVIGRL